MITVDEARTFRPIDGHSKPNAPVEVQLTEEEQVAFDYIDSCVESGIYKSFDASSSMVDIHIPPEFTSPTVVAALKRKYETGGWVVAVFRQFDGAGKLSDVQVVFAMPPGAPSAPEKESQRPLPPVCSADSFSTKTSGIIRPTAAGYRILVRMPTRGRPAQALDVLQKYRDMAGAPVEIEVVLDDDDETMNNCEVLQRLNALGCSICIDDHSTKIAAVNGGRRKDWDILLLASDDMVPVTDQYAERVQSAVTRHFPHLDGAIFFDDGHQGGELCTLPIIGRRFYDLFGYVYHPAYTSLFSDTEQTQLWRAMGRLVYVDEKIIEHRHHVWRQAEKDELYVRNDAFEDADKDVFEKRRVLCRPDAQFAFDSPPLWLSICIASLPARGAQLHRLLAYLTDQRSRFYSPREVEFLIDSSEGVNIGEKRQALLKRARGHFVAFIDDDDWVAHDYIWRVVNVIRNQRDLDCVSLNGFMTTRGGHPEKFSHSLVHKEWSTKNGVHLRSPNHLNAVKRELALQAGFASMSHGEDHDYSKRLLPLLKRESSCGEAPLYFYWFNPVK